MGTQTDSAWALARLERMQAIAQMNAGRLGTKLLQGHGYPDEAMSDAQDALSMQRISGLR